MHQRRQTALKNKETRQNNRLREERRLQHSLLVSIKSTAALYFYNQKLMNQFFQNTLQHPYFQQFKLPLSFNQTLRKLGLGSDHVDKVNLDHKDADPNHDPDPVNHDLDVVGDDDNEDDDNDDAAHDHALDDNQYSHTSFLSKNVKVLCTTGPKFRKNSARVDFATCQDELKPKFLAKI